VEGDASALASSPLRPGLASLDDATGRGAFHVGLAGAGSAVKYMAIGPFALQFKATELARWYGLAEGREGRLCSTGPAA
jgi:hypothetical protein